MFDGPAVAVIGDGCGGESWDQRWWEKEDCRCLLSRWFCIVLVYRGFKSDRELSRSCIHA